MNVDHITARSARDALRAIHYAKPMVSNPLLAMDALVLALREADVADTPRSREWALGSLIGDLVWDRLERLRAEQAAGPRTDIDATQELSLLTADFASDNLERQAWSALHGRYLAMTRLPVADMARTLLVSQRTIERRIGRGHKLLARALRAAELAAEAGAGKNPGAPPAERVLIDADPEGTLPIREMAGATTELAAVVRDDAAVLHLTAREAERIARGPAEDLEAYRVARVAEWSRPPYRLDERFVALTLLVDRGEEEPEGRWRAEPFASRSLLESLERVVDPAAVVLGPPGSGKSTLLRRMDMDVAIAGLRGETQQVAFFTSLGRYGSRRGAQAKLPDPREWLGRGWSRRFPALPALEALLEEGRLVLLLDALNEMPYTDAADRHHRVALWKAFLQDIAAGPPGNRVVFSSRSLDYSAPLSTPTLRVPQLRIEPLDDPGIRRFLARYLPDGADGLWAALERSPQLEVLRSPYTLGLLVEQTDREGVVPDDLSALFTNVVRRALRREVERDHPLFAPSTLLVERDLARLIANRRWRDAYELPERGRLLPALASLAHAGQLRTPGGQARLDYDEAIRILDDHRAEDMLRAGESISVLDEDRERDEVLYAHQLMQEYFAARHLAREADLSPVDTPWHREQVEPDLEQVLAELGLAEPLPPLPSTGWEESVVMAAAMAADAEAFVRAVAACNLPLAGRCAARPEVLCRLPEECLDSLRRSLEARCRNPEADLRARIQAADRLGELGDPRLALREGPHGAYRMPALRTLPGGLFGVGGDAPLENMGYESDAHVPRHTVEILPLAFGRFPVTNAEWACFIEGGGYEDDRWWETPDAAAWRRGEGTLSGVRANMRRGLELFSTDPALLDHYHEVGQIHDESYERWCRWIAMTEKDFEASLDETFPDERYTHPRMWREPGFDNPSQPVTGICWYEARAYAAWLSAQSGLPFRLPTEPEWERAAAGTKGRAFAWGDTFSPLHANTHEAHVRRPSPVGVFPEGDTPEGIADLTGNVYEWTSTAWGDADEAPGFAYPYDLTDDREKPDLGPEMRRVFRGGSWNDRVLQAHTIFRGYDHPNGRGPDYGCRLCHSSEERS